MSKYKMAFSFRHGGGALWSLNDVARKEYGHFVELKRLPLSDTTIDIANEMSREHETRLDWNAPHAKKPIWSREEERDFKRRSRTLYKQVTGELGSDYRVYYNNRRANARGFRETMIEKGFSPKNVNNQVVTMMAKVEPYFDSYIENTNYDDYVYRGNHFRLAIGKNGQVIDMYPLDDYTPNFYPEKLKEVALSAIPYELNAPEIKMFDSKDPDIQARRRATFARLSLEHHYGTKDMSKWV